MLEREVPQLREDFQSVEAWDFSYWPLCHYVDGVLPVLTAPLPISSFVTLLFFGMKYKDCFQKDYRQTFLYM